MTEIPLATFRPYSAQGGSVLNQAGLSTMEWFQSQQGDYDDRLPDGLTSSGLVVVSGAQNFKGRHNEGSVAIHVDGHAKWYRFLALYPRSVQYSGQFVEWYYWGLACGAESVR
jgi:hypothetical protein